MQDPVAWHDDRQRVRAERVAGGAECARTAGLKRDLLVGRDRAERDPCSGPQDTPREAARELPVDRELEVVAMAGEVLLELPARLVEAARGCEQARRDALGKALQDRVLGAVVVEVGEAEQTAIAGGDQQPADGGVERRAGDVEQPGGGRANSSSSNSVMASTPFAIA